MEERRQGTRPAMIVELLNVGLPKRELFVDKEIITGICKKPISGQVVLNELGFDGDGVADTKNHGGSDKAVCVYSLDHYPFWEETLGIQLPPAAFGENLSVCNLQEDDVCLGDIFFLGTATVQISQPRQPCKTLAARYGRNDLVKLIINSGRTGFYLRVLEEGVVETGCSLLLKEGDPRRISVAFANRTYHHHRKNRDDIDSILAVPALSKAWQFSLQKMKARCS